MSSGIPLAAALAAAVLGALLGCVTGLVPGLHSNNVAATLAAAPAVVLLIVGAGAVDPGSPGGALAVSCAIVACAAAGAVSSAVPGVYLGAPEGKAVLSVLPGHRLLLAGNGREALRLHVGAAAGALAVALLLLLPLRWAMGPPLALHRTVMGWLGPVLLLVAAVMLGLEACRRPGVTRRLVGWRATAAALVLLLAAALLGEMVVFADGALLAASGTGIGALFVGLFGLPTLLWAMLDPPSAPPPEASDTGRGSGRDHRRWSVVVKGALVGAVVGWFPGTSSGQATMLVVVGGEATRHEDLEGARRYIAGAAAVGASNVVFNLAALATMLRARSGAAVAVQGLMGWTEAPWTEGHGLLPAPEVAALLLAAAVGVAVAAPVTLLVGRLVAGGARRLRSPRLLLSIAVILVLACILPGGLPAALVLLAATSLGMLPPALGLMRVHLMGAMTVPIALGLILGGM